MDSSNTLLWLTGEAGCGKSVLCSRAVAHIQQYTHQPATIYLFLTHDRSASEYQLTAQLALQLLDHVCHSGTGVDSQAFLEVGEVHADDLMLAKVRELIKLLVASCPSVFFFIDGLDEIASDQPAESESQEEDKPYSSNKQLYSVLSFLSALSRDRCGSHLRLWCSSRKTSIISKWMDEFKAVELPIDTHVARVGVARYLDQKLDLPGMNSNIYDSDLTRDLLDPVHENFLLAYVFAGRYGRLDLSSAEPPGQVLFKTPNSLNELYQERLDELLRLDESHEVSWEGEPVSML